MQMDAILVCLTIEEIVLKKRILKGITKPFVTCAMISIK